MLLDAHAKGLIENAHVYGDDFGSPDETYISNQFDRPVMVHRYPAAVKAFYMQPDPQDATKALCVDVLAPEGYGEIIGGSQRVDSLRPAEAAASRSTACRWTAFQWYLDLRKYGIVPHSGFGMGIERCGGVDLRAGPCARDDPVCADAEPDLSVVFLGMCGA